MNETILWSKIRYSFLYYFERGVSQITKGSSFCRSNDIAQQNFIEKQRRGF